MLRHKITPSESATKDVITNACQDCFYEEPQPRRLVAELDVNEKAPPPEREAGPETGGVLDLRDVLSLKALGALADLKLHKLAFVQRLVSIHLDGGEVNEDIFTRLALDEPITLCCVEPLHHTLFSSQRYLLLCE
jgi:hypothetical protein